MRERVSADLSALCPETPELRGGQEAAMLERRPRAPVVRLADRVADDENGRRRVGGLQQRRPELGVVGVAVVEREDDRPRRRQLPPFAALDVLVQGDDRVAAQAQPAKLPAEARRGEHVAACPLSLLPERVVHEDDAPPRQAPPLLAVAQRLPNAAPEAVELEQAVDASRRASREEAVHQAE